MIGQVVGKYRVVGQLGRGAMGTVYRAVDETLYREVAVKVLNPDLVDTPIMKRFRSEATVLARLNHPVIATIYELLTTDDGDTLIVMELVPGETLERICTRMGPMAPAHAMHIVDRILAALDHAHRAGIVHCDIKPANIMVTAQGDVKIMDFGTARVPGKKQETADKYMMGTPAYMPPEQVTGQSIDGRSDLYAVGVVLYRMLTGTPPFVADSLIGVMQKQISEEPAPLAAHREGLPAWCETIVMKAMAKAPADRFQTAGEFSAALRTAGAVMRPPVGVAHPDLIATAAAVERRDSRTDPLAGPPTVPIPQKTVTSAHPVFGTSAGRPAARGPRPEAPAPMGDWRPLAVAIGVVVVAIMVVLRFGGGSLQTMNAPAPARPAAAPPVAQTAPAPATTPTTLTPTSDPGVRGRGGPAPAGRAANPALGAAGRGTALPPQPPQPPLASIATAPPHAAMPGAATPATTEKPASKVATPAVFESRVLVRGDDGSRERDGRIVLADGKIHVQAADDSSALQPAIAYEDVTSISYSRGRDPMWNAPAGPEQVAKAGGGAFGIFRGTRHWVSVRTSNPKNRFLVLRLGNDVQAKRAITLLEERTGRRVQNAGPADK